MLNLALYFVKQKRRRESDNRRNKNLQNAKKRKQTIKFTCLNFLRLLTNLSFLMDMDKILCDMRQHISNLQDKLQVANSAVSKGQIVNEKITLMKEYQDKIASLNSCWRARNRTQLVHNLQQESRQIIALEEENRQLRFALKEMEDGLHLIMNDYRKIFSGFMRAEELDKVATAQGKLLSDNGLLINRGK